MSALSFQDFWFALESRGCAHPFENNGQRRSYDEMPETMFDLTDNPWRSLAGALKRAGGYAKIRAPYSEFRWADFLRSRIASVSVERDFGRALELALKLARSREAMHMTGWFGAGSNNTFAAYPAANIVSAWTNQAPGVELFAALNVGTGRSV